jgi:hypothetical protein
MDEPGRRLPFEQRQKSIADLNEALQVDVDLARNAGRILRLWTGEIEQRLDAGVVHSQVEARMAGGQSGGEAGDRYGIGNVDHFGFHTGIARGNGGKFVGRLPGTDARSAAGDECNRRLKTPAAHLPRSANSSTRLPFSQSPRLLRRDAAS